MNDPDKKSDEVVIGEAVRAEEEAALAKFRSGRFRECLEERLQAEAARPARPVFARSIPGPVWAAAGALLLFAGGLLALRLLRTAAPDGSLTVASLLRRLPGIQAIENRPAAASEAIHPAATPFDAAISGALAGRGSVAGAPHTTDRSEGIAAVNPKAEPLDLKELYDILVIEKSVERVLLMISQETKEG